MRVDVGYQRPLEASGTGSVSTRRRRVGVWWLSPGAAFLGVLSLSIALTLTVPPSVFESQWRTAYAITTDTAVVFVLGAISVTAGAFVGALLHARTDRRTPGRPGLSDELLRASVRWLFWMTTLGYVAFFIVGAARGLTVATLAEAVSQQNVESGEIENTLGTIPGVTTFTQFGPACVTVASLLYIRQRSVVVGIQLLIVVFLGLLRAFFLTERLAVLELLVPLVVVFASSPARTQLRRRVRSLLPVVALPLVITLFGVFEYTRSWQTYSATFGGSVYDFTLQRFAGYYATAYNNSAVVLEHRPLEGMVPHYTLEMLWRAPMMDQLGVEDRLNGYSFTDYYARMLYNFANPEFNNIGGVGSAVLDWGPVLGILILGVMGLCSGVLYSLFDEESPVGVLLYPVWFVGVLELPRYVYWTQGRALPCLVALLVVALLARKRRAREF